MPWWIWLGSKTLWAPHRTRFLRWMVRLSLLGIATGVAAMAIVLSVMDGFESQLKGRLFRSEIHLLVEPTASAPSFDKGTVLEDDAPLDSRGWTPQSKVAVLQREMLLRGARRVSGVVAKGLPGAAIQALQKQVIDARATLPDGAAEEGGELSPLWLGSELAADLALLPGDEVLMISPLEFTGPLQNIPRAKTFRVEGIVQTGSPDSEQHAVWVEKSTLQNFLRLPGRMSQWEILLPQLDDTGVVKELLKTRMPQWRVRDWRDLNQKLFSALHLERIAMFVILGLIVLVGSFNIVATLTLLVLEKRREIAILRTIGASRKGIVRLFLFEAFWLSSAGIVVGLLVTFVVIEVLRSGNWIQLPDAYYDRTLPVSIVPGYYIAIAGFTMGLALLAGRGPALRAADWTIIEGIQRKGH